MKKFKYYKTLLTLTMAGTLALVSGCGKKEEKENNVVKKSNSECVHLKVDIDGDGTLEYFKECDGYEITASHYKTSALDYDIKFDDEVVLSGTTLNYYCAKINHEYIEQMEENENTKVFKKIK